jgi:ADP-heptose:LPS heptosyltransferase
MFLATESGLVHAATAVDTKSLVIITGYQSEKMVAYPQNINVNISSHGPCGLKIECPECKKDAENHNPKDIVKIVLDELCLNV